jgi:hypothetical protein
MGVLGGTVEQSSRSLSLDTAIHDLDVATDQDQAPEVPGVVMTLGMRQGCPDLVKLDTEPATLEQGETGEAFTNLFPADLFVWEPSPESRFQIFQNTVKHTYLSAHEFNLPKSIPISGTRGRNFSTSA